MTNIENAIARGWNSHGITEGKPKKGIAADDSVAAVQCAFAEALNGVTSENALSLTPPDTAPDITIPEHWTSDELWGYGVVAINVNKFLKEQGIDTSARTPTYEITDEQRDWLASRHDFEAIKNGGDSKELGELLGDLIYMNVISSGDAVDLMSPGLPINSANPNTLTYLGDSDYSVDEIDLILERIKKLIEMHRETIRLNQAQWNTDYIEKTGEFIKTKQTCYELLSSLLTSADETDNAFGILDNRNVVDSTEQLKADFSAMLS